MAFTHHAWGSFQYQGFAALRRMEGAHVGNGPVDGVALNVGQAAGSRSELFRRDRQRGQVDAVKALGVGEEGGVALRTHFSDDLPRGGDTRRIVLLCRAA